MKTTFLILTLFAFNAANAQNADKIMPVEKQSKLTFGWVYSGEVAYRFLSAAEEQVIGIPTSEFIDFRNSVEKPKFGQTVNFFLGYALSDRFTLEGGLGFTDFGEAMEPVEIVDFDPGGNTAYLATISTTNHLLVGTVPISLHVHLGGNKVKGFVSAGISPGLLLRYMTNSRYEYANGDQQTSSYFSASQQNNYSKFILGAHVSGGIEYQYNAQTSVRIAPVFRVTTNSAYKDASIRGNYFNAGIEFGSIYRL